MFIEYFPQSLLRGRVKNDKVFQISEDDPSLVVDVPCAPDEFQECGIYRYVSRDEIFFQQSSVLERREQLINRQGPSLHEM